MALGRADVLDGAWAFFGRAVANLALSGNAWVYRSDVRVRSLQTFLLLLGVSLLLPAASIGQQSPPVVSGAVDVREVGVVVDLPRSLRDLSAAELERRLTVLEAGVERSPVSVGTLAGDGVDAYGRVLIVVDRERCSQEILVSAAAALGDQAERLVALGPVEVHELGESLVLKNAPTRSSAALAAALAQQAREPCGPAPDVDRAPRVALAAGDFACPATACLAIWVGPGWGGQPGAAAVPADSSSVTPLARLMASSGWLFVAAPILPADETESRASVRDAERQPGSDRHTFGINVLRRPDARPVSAAEYSRFVDLWLTPLRRLVAATAGEFVDREDQLGERLDALGGRSVLWYRTDRRSDGSAATLEVRQARTEGQKYRAAEWAPERGD